LDLLVIIPDGVGAKEYYDAVNAPFYAPVAVDWIFLSNKEFTTNKEIGGVARMAFLTGKKVWPHGSTE
jgi:hypothetical protein